MICCDTSFLFSIYAQDVFTVKALDEARSFSQPVTISVLNEFEFSNAVRCSVFRRVISDSDAALVLNAFADDRTNEKIVLAACNLPLVLSEAKRLSTVHAITGGHRSFDILHVAAALHLGAQEFLSFDRNQRKLAKAEGLKIRPV